MTDITTIITSIVGGGAIGGIVTQITNYLLKKREMGVSVENMYLQNLEKRMKEQDEKIRDCDADRERLNIKINTLEDVINRLERKEISATVVCDDHGKIVDWNAAATSLFYYTRDEAIGKNIQILMPARYRSTHLSAFMSAVTEKRGPLKTEPRNLTAMNRNGIDVPVTINLSAYETRDRWFYVAEIRLRDESTRSDSEIFSDFRPPSQR